MELLKSIFFRQALFVAIFTAFAVFSACEEPPKTNEKSKTVINLEAPDGYAVFRKFCVNCHGADGKLGLSGAKQIPESKLSQAERELLVRKGRNLMTPFESLLTDAEIRAVAEFTFSLK